MGRQIAGTDRHEYHAAQSHPAWHIFHFLLNTNGKRHGHGLSIRTVPRVQTHLSVTSNSQSSIGLFQAELMAFPELH